MSGESSAQSQCQSQSENTHTPLPLSVSTDDALDSIGNAQNFDRHTHSEIVRDMAYQRAEEALKHNKFNSLLLLRQFVVVFV